MTEHRGPLFLERRGYRRRRMTDAARMLPVLGAVLFAVPLLWPDNADAPSQTPMSAALVYIFGLWLILIGLAAILAPKVGRDTDNPPKGR
jgi:predicted phage tail protein